MKDSDEVPRRRVPVEHHTGAADGKSGGVGRDVFDAAAVDAAVGVAAAPKVAQSTAPAAIHSGADGGTGGCGGD